MGKRVSRWERNRLVQEAEDARHRAEGYTGGSYSIMSGAWDIWIEGRLVGAAPTADEAYSRALQGQQLPLSPRGG